MKEALIIITAVLVTFSVYAQNNCNTYYPFEAGTILKYESADKKGKLQQSEIHKVLKAEEIGSKLSLVMGVQLFDKKGKLQMENEYSAICEEGKLYMDMRNSFNNEMLESFQDMEFVVEGEPLLLPNELEVGQELPEGDMEIKAESGGMGISNIKFTIFDRKVIAKETISTAAGTFDCFVIEQSMKMDWLIDKNYKSKEYYSKGAGVVRIETFTKSGKLQGTRDLVSIERK